MTAAPSRLWWTAAELAEARLPDLPASKRAVNALAEREGWARAPRLARRRAGKGGGWEYHWTLLPSRAQGALIAAARAPADAPAAPATPARMGRDEAWTWFEGLPEGPKAEAARRLLAVQAVEALEAGGSSRHLAVAEAARRHGAGARTLWTWLDLVAGARADDRLPYLAPRHRAARRASRRVEVDARFGDLLKADVLRDSRPSVTSAYDRCRAIAEAKGIPVPPLHAARRWLRRSVSPAAWTLARQGVEALSRMRPAQVRDKTTLRAMEAVNADFHRFDVFARFPASPDGQREEVARPQMVAIQDVYSGRLLAWRVDRTANSHAAQLCFGELIERWGIPERVLLDNGREFAAKIITGGAKTRFRFRVREDDMEGLLTSLGCQIHWATPYSGQSKPIERAFRDLCDRVAKHPAFQGAYTGNRPDAKPESHGSRAVPLATFVEVLEREIAAHNARPGRRSEVAFGRSFAEAFDESYARGPVRRATAAQRRLWLMGAEGLRAHRDSGQLSFMGNRYHAPWMVAIRERRVTARFDRDDLWAGLHVYGLDGAYLGFAPCIAKVGFFDAAGARVERKLKRDWLAASKAELAAARRLTAADVAAELAALPGTAEEAPPAATVIRPVFDGGARARPAEAPAEGPAEVADLVARLQAREAPVGEGRAAFARAREILARLDGGGAVTDAQAAWARSYATTPEFRAWAALVEDFGEGALG